MRITVYIVKKDLPLGFLKAGSEIVEVSKGVYECNGQQVPNCFDFSSKEYFEEHTYFQMKYDVGRKVVFYNPSGMGNNKIGVVQRMDDITGEYEIKYLNSEKTDWFMENEIIGLADPYYFINSAGDIQMTYKHLNPKADEFRSKIDNMFMLKENAETKKFLILGGNFKKLLC